MFEKDAEERFEKYKQLPKWKGKIFMQDEKTCFIDGYHECEKEHEWHYPSKGELPTCDEKTQLAFYVTCYYGDITRKRLVLGYYQKSFLNDDVMVFTEKSKGYGEEHLTKDVIAWKEIVLPKEIE